MPNARPTADAHQLAHDVLNAIGPILNAVELIRMTAGSSAVEDYLKMIARQTDRIRDLVADAEARQR